MTQSEIYNRLYRGGAFALPFLIRITVDGNAFYYVNNNEDVTYDGNVYEATTFEYTRPKSAGGYMDGGQLAITSIDNDILGIIDNAENTLQVDVIGVIDERGEVSPVSVYHHKYCTATINADMSVTLAFEPDDRLDMQFPPYIFDKDNNRGNA